MRDKYCINILEFSKVCSQSLATMRMVTINTNWCKLHILLTIYVSHIAQKHCILEVTNCTFTGNNASFGGAIFVEVGAKKVA